MMIGVDRPAVLVRFHVRDGWLIGVAVVQAAGAPVIVRARANLAQMEALYRRILESRVRASAGAEVAVGWGFIKKAFKKIKKAVKKVARGKVFKAIGRGVRKVMKSKVLKVALTAASVAFPAVGIPAQAAFVASNRILAGVEKGSRAARKAVKALSRAAKKRTRTGKKARKALRILSATNSWRKGLKVAQARGLSPAALAARRRRAQKRAAQRRTLMRRKLARVRALKRLTPAQLAALRRMTPAQKAAFRRMAAARRAAAGGAGYPAVGDPLEVIIRHQQAGAVGGACSCG